MPLGGARNLPAQLRRGSGRAVRRARRRGRDHHDNTAAAEAYRTADELIDQCR